MSALRASLPRRVAPVIVSETLLPIREVFPMRAIDCGYGVAIMWREVRLDRSVLDHPVNDVRAALLLADELMEAGLVQDALFGSAGPVYDLLTNGDPAPASAEAVWNVIRAWAARQETAAAKAEMTQRRRRQFSARRDQIALLMIDHGHQYVCAVRGCGAHTGLTIDHVVPLSRGGTDSLDNLQFMCARHNSEKGDSSP